MVRTFAKEGIMKNEQLKRAGEVFDADLARDLEDPEFSAIYALKLAKVNAMADFLDAIEERREEQQLSKAEIGRRINRQPSAVSRILNGNDQNPTWDTLVDLAYAVGIELEVKVKRAPKRTKKPHAPVKVLVA